MNRICKLAMVAALLSATASAQATWVVDSRGGGDFFILPQAVDRAAVGDTIIIRSGHYNGTSIDNLIEKGLTILCDPGVVWGEAFRTTRPWVIRGIPANQSFTWRGGQFRAIPGQSMVIRDCQGPVLIEGFDSWSSISVENSSNVYLHNISMSNFAHLSLSNSTVTMTDCTIDLQRRTAPLEIRSSQVSIGRSSIVSRGFPGFPAPIFAIESISSALTIGARTHVESWRSSMSAIGASSGGLVELDPSAVVVSKVTPMIQGTAQVVDVPRSVVSASSAAVGEVFRVTAYTEPDSLIATFVETRFMSPVPTPFGDLWVRPIARILDFGRADANGERSFSVVVPQIAPGFPIVLQPIALSISGELTIGIASGIVMN